MRPTHWGAYALALCSMTTVAVIAQQSKPNASKPSSKAASSKPTAAVIDTPVAEFKLVDLMHEKKPGESPDAAKIALSDYKDKKSIVLFFMSEQCDVTWRYEKRMGQLMQQFGKKEVAFFSVRCSAADTPQSICKFAESKNFAMPLLNDANGQMTSYFHVTNTPSFVLIDKKGTLRYFGSFDDYMEENGVKKRYLPDAITAVLSDKVVSIKQTKPFG